MPATIFSGSKVKTLKKTLSLNGGAEVISTTTDPTSGAGLAAPIGTLVLNETTGFIYQKTGALDTDWVLASSTGALPLTGGTMTGDITFASGFGDVTSGGLVSGKLINIQVLTATASSTYTPTAGTRLIRAAVVGGGGGSGGTGATSTSTVTCSPFGGDGGFVYFIAKITDATGTFQCGTAGTAGTSAPGIGGSGGTTTFQMGSAGANINVSCTGGSGGSPATITGTISSASQAANGSETISGLNIVYSKSRVVSGNGHLFGYDIGAITELHIHRYPSEFSKIYIGPTIELSLSHVDSTFNLAYSLSMNAEGYGCGGSGKVNFATTAQAGVAGIQGAIYIEEYA